MEIICSRTTTCTFRAHDRYFRDKTRFYPGVCPVCNGPIRVVEDRTDTVVIGKIIDTDVTSSTFREVIDVVTA